MTISRPRRVVHFGCMILIVLLYIISVPWYRDDGAPLRLWLGLPDWVAVALICYVAVAILNAIAWAVADVPDSWEDLSSSDGTNESEAPR